MTVKRQSFNNGTQGDVISAANSADSGDAISITVDVNGKGVYKVGAALRGAKGAHVTGSASDTFQIVLSNTSNTSGTGQVYFRMNTYPSTGGAIFRLRSSAGNVALFVISNTGVLSIQNSAGTGLKNFMSNTQLALNTTYRLNLRATPNASTTAGYIAGELFGDNDLLLDSYSSGAVNAGTTLNVQTAAAGKLAAAADGFDMYFDELAFETGTTVALRPVTPVLAQNTAEGGTGGTTVTTGNSGGSSGTAFDLVTLGTGNISFSTTVAHTGTYSFNVTPGSASSAYVSYQFSSVYAITRMSARFYVYFTGYPTASTQVLNIGSGTTAGNLCVNTSGRPFVQDGSGTANTGTNALTLNTWLRVEYSVYAGTTSADGTIIVNIYTGDSLTSPLYSYSSNARNTSTTPIQYLNLGKASSTGDWSTMYFDDITLTDTDTPVPMNTAVAPWVFA